MKFNVYDNVLVKGTLKVTMVLDDRCNGYYYCSDRGTYSESEIEITDLPSNDGVEELEDITSKNLTQAELQFLTKHLATRLSFNSCNIDYHKREAARYWKDCDKDSGQSVDSFNMLNIHKEHLKKEKKLHTKLSEIQRKLKKQASR